MVSSHVFNWIMSLVLCRRSSLKLATFDTPWRTFFLASWAFAWSGSCRSVPGVF
jgi:hypothetical protein